MGAIDGAVLNGVIASEPQLQKVLHPFLNDFDISWGAKRAAFNATLYQFIAKPSAIFSETFCWITLEKRINSLHSSCLH